jgi:type 1 glutamine amidotransferase
MTLMVFVAATPAQPTTQTAAGEPLRALIIDGQNNHDNWPKTTWMMKQYLEETGQFRVDIARTRYTWQGQHLMEQFPLDDGKRYEPLEQPKTDPDFKPKFADYQVVVNNLGYGAAPLPKETQTALVEYMRQGGGLVVVHAADNCWPEWKEYNEMIGLGGWGGRNEKSGPYVYFNDAGSLVVDQSKGNGGHHGAQHDFVIKVRESAHPILAGLPNEFMHGKDELYEQLRGPAKNMTVIATAFAAREQGGSNRHEPVLMTIDYEKGRVFHTVLGHADYSMESVAFIGTFVRGTEWAATGKVAISAPDNFPNKDATSVRKFEMSR